MERTIKFKAKRLDNGKWVKGSLLLSEKGKTCIGTILDSNEENGSPVCFQCKKVDPSTVCQFTGLKDKNGKDIFENDVIEITYENGYIQKGVVEYFQDAFVGVNGGIHIHICLYGGCNKNILKRVVNLGSKFDRKEGEK